MKKKKKQVENEEIKQFDNFQDDEKYTNDFEDFIQRRKKQCEGLTICNKCGGILWKLDEENYRCGDCKRLIHSLNEN